MPSVATARHVVPDALVVARRNLIRIRRVPELLIFTTLSPIMFVLLFAFVFGGAIDPARGGDGYREYLMAGIFVQTLLFAATNTGAGLAGDVREGIVDRLRSLPMANSAVLFGRTISDVVGNALVLVVMSVSGLAVGWRIDTSIPDALGGYLLILAFAYAFSWVMAWLGLLVRSPAAINNASFVFTFPMTFIANTFVPIDTLPGPLQTFAQWNPVSAVTQAARERFGNPDPNPSAVPPDAWPLQNPELYTLIWVAALVLVFAPLAGCQYRRSASR